MDTSEPSPPPSHPLRDLVLRVYCYLVVLGVLYVLSAGPMYWAVYEAYHADGSRFVAQLYLPLVLLSEFEPIGRVVNWYVGLWIL